MTLIVLCLGELMIVLDTTIVNVALPSIRADLGFTETSLVWVVNAYMLTFGGFLLLGGRLGDYYGHRKLFLIGLWIYSPSQANVQKRWECMGLSVPVAVVSGYCWVGYSLACSAGTGYF
jgi:MFS family permease